MYRIGLCFLPNKALFGLSIKMSMAIIGGSGALGEHVGLPSKCQRTVIMPHHSGSRMRLDVLNEDNNNELEVVSPLVVYPDQVFTDFIKLLTEIAKIIPDFISFIILFIIRYLLYLLFYECEKGFR